jgi:hypothetical protein
MPIRSIDPGRHAHALRSYSSYPMDFLSMRINVLAIWIPTVPHMPIRWIVRDRHGHAMQPYSSYPMDLDSMPINVLAIWMPTVPHMPIRSIDPDPIAHGTEPSYSMIIELPSPSRDECSHAGDVCTYSTGKDDVDPDWSASMVRWVGNERIKKQQGSFYFLCFIISRLPGAICLVASMGDRISTHRGNRTRSTPCPILEPHVVMPALNGEIERDPPPGPFSGRMWSCRPRTPKSAPRRP